MFPAMASMVFLGLLTFGVKADIDIEQLARAVEDIQVEINGLKRRCSDAPPGGFIQEDGYILALRMMAGKGPFDEWSWGYETNGEEPFVQSMRQCTCNTASGPCNRHYRSSLINCWDRIPISEVKLSLYKNGEEKQFIIFNGTATTFWTDPFLESKLLDSSWVDLKTTTHVNFFYGDYWASRYYDFSHVFGDCATDAGWMFIKTMPDKCAWATSKNDSYPLILYSPASTLVQYESGAEQADALALWIKLKNIDNLNAPCVQ